MTAAILTIDGNIKRRLAIAALMAAQIPFLLATRNPAFVHHLFAVTATIALVQLGDLIRRR